MKTFSRPGKINAYNYLLAVSFLSTGMTAFLTFPRSMRLYDLGVSVALYGLLLAGSNLILLLMNIIVGRIVDRYGCLGNVLKCALGLCILSHFVYIFSGNLLILSIFLVVENASSKLFASFISEVVSGISDRRYGSGLGYYKLAGSIAWAICATASGYISGFLGFQALMCIVFLFSIVKMFCLFKLLAAYKMKTAGYEKKTKNVIPVKSILTPAMVNVLCMYTVMQLQSNGGFSYLQIYMSSVLGIDEIRSGYILAASGIFEIAIALLLGRICDISAKSLRIAISVGAFLSALRWVVLGNTEIGVPGLLFTQCLHGVMICTINIAFIDYLRLLSSNQSFGTAIGIAGALSSLGTMTASSLFGFAGDAFGLSKAYMGLGIICMAAALGYTLLDIAITYRNRNMNQIVAGSCTSAEKYETEV